MFAPYEMSEIWIRLHVLAGGDAYIYIEGNRTAKYMYVWQVSKDVNVMNYELDVVRWDVSQASQS